MANTGTATNASKWKFAVGMLLVGVIVAAALATGVPARMQTLLQSALDWIEGLGAWGPILFIALYIAATVLLVPGSVLTLGAGTVFGLAWGMVCVSAGATLGATAAFLVGRYLARGWVARKMAHHPKFRAVDEAVAREGWKIVLLTRLSPVFPFVLLNYAFGLTRVRLGHYFLASWIGMIPGTLIYVYIGTLVRTGVSRPTATEWLLKGAGLLATVAVTWFITRIARRALSAKLPPLASEGPGSQTSKPFCE
jgi:uncharacterized membrane protein YdjX (TVP38/TMEM64 family)